MMPMPAGETEASPSPWTIDSLHQHLSELMAEADRRYEQRFDAQEKAVSKAEVAAEKRFDSVNEFRAQLSDQSATFLPRAVAEVRFDAMQKEIAVGENWRSKATGAAIILTLVAGALGGAIVKAFGG